MTRIWWHWRSVRQRRRCKYTKTGTIRLRNPAGSSDAHLVALAEGQAAQAGEAGAQRRHTGLAQPRLVVQHQHLYATPRQPVSFPLVDCKAMNTAAGEHDKTAQKFPQSHTMHGSCVNAQSHSRPVLVGGWKPHLQAVQDRQL